jgi:pimeloyl-ACP methyl ester carboxylesterase
MLEEFVDPSVFPDWLTEKDLDYFVKNFTAGGFRGPLNRYRNSEKDFLDLPLMGVARIKQPSCFIAGSKDLVRSFVPEKDGYANVDELCDDMRISRIIEGAGHWVQQETPEEVNNALLEFLNTLP